MEEGDYERAAVALLVAIEARPEAAYLWYSLACCRARTGARDSALDALEKAAALGFGHREHMASDEDLESLRGEARFQALVDAEETTKAAPPSPPEGL
jgi:predicted Zn-dependent protease